MIEIKLKNVSLSYPIYGTDARSLKTTMINIATGGRLERDCRRCSVQALTDITFNLQQGDCLALIGHNGAGKSSLLKVLAKIYEPTVGSISVKGRVNCLFDIMMGMDQELNGYENIKLRGLILGLKQREIQDLIPRVEEFAELGEFMKVPIKTYSSGMKVRLAFGIIVNIFSEILLIDEIVNVGDARFMVKAKEYMKSLVHESDIMVLSSHDTQLIREFCNKAIWLEKGEIKHFGNLEEVLKLYQDH